jgi:N-acetylmuramoyl-L-alanine amidase
MRLAIRERASPNHGDRKASIDMLVLHYTGMKTAAESLERLCDPAAEVSAHYLVEEEGTVWRLVAEERRAWHAGRGFWAGTRDINSASIGIEIQNPGHEWGYRAFPEAQIAAVERLCREILARHPIPADRVVGHSDVAPERKEDPGELFDWRRLARGGIGVWPSRIGTARMDEDAARRALSAIGYDPEASPKSVVTAFQRRWRPARCDGTLDEETAGLVAAVAEEMGRTWA